MSAPPPTKVRALPGQGQPPPGQGPSHVGTERQPPLLSGVFLNELTQRRREVCVQGCWVRRHACALRSF